MARSSAFQGQIPFLQVVNDQGEVDAAEVPDLPVGELQAMYEAMQLTRVPTPRVSSTRWESCWRSRSRSTTSEARLRPTSV